MSPAAVRLALAGDGRGRGGEPGPVAALRAVLRPEFLAEAGWDEAGGVLAPPRSHPLLGLRECAVVDCTAGIRRGAARLCRPCEARFRASGLELGQFVAVVSGKTSRGQRLCRVAGCQRPTSFREGWCYAHGQRRRLTPALTAEQFSAQARPLPAYGNCRVASCVRRAQWSSGLCVAHQVRWRKHRKAEPGADLAAWAQRCAPVTDDSIVILKGLPERVRVELLVGVQQRTEEGTKTALTALRAVVTALREARAASIHDLDPAAIKQARHDGRQLLRFLQTAVRRRLSSPQTERGNDVWDLSAFGVPGRLRFTEISQPWLREAAKHWAEEDLPRHRGRQAGATAKAVVAAVARLSASLRESREDGGNDPRALARRDVVTLTNRLAHLQRTGEVTELMRVQACRYLRRFLTDLRALGLTRVGGPAAGLPDDVVLTRGDIPPQPDTGGPGRGLPDWALHVVNDNLHVLAERSGADTRRMVELLIDTGRRPDEICQLPWDCLDRDSDGKPTLLYTDSKNHKPGRRLPIAEATAAVIGAAKDDVRRRFPDTPPGELVLFPRDNSNPRGTHPYTEQVFTNAHRRFINAIADQLVTEVIEVDGTRRVEQLDRLAVVPYSYRHAYAQRHADEGVPPDVLRDLMGHDKIQTTLHYYRVTEKRARVAIDRVSGHQFNAHGRRVFTAITGLLADEHARMRVGQVAVPFGICTEPANVKAGGQACPYKFTCLGCGHFRSDPSYLPELKSYLQQKLADQERLRAATDLQDWARTHLSPPEQEITGLRELIRRIETDVDALSDADQQRIAEAVAVIRSTRQAVNLGMPAIQPTSTESG